MGYEDVHRRAGVPFYYPLVFILNIALVMIFELFVFYKYPVPITEEILAAKNPAYESAVFLKSDDGGSYLWYLTETESGELHLVPTRRHALFFNRCRIYDQDAVLIPADVDQMEVKIQKGLSASTMVIGNNAEVHGMKLEGEGIQMRTKYYGGGATAGRYALAFYVFWGLLLSLLEAWIVHILKPK